MQYNQILEDSTGSEHIIEIKDLCKSFDGTKVLKNITFYIRNNEFITLLGPSGCGKSTTLRIIAGFETADSGIVNFEGKDLKSVPANKRNINTVFQRYALFPHLNVFDNVAFGLKIKKVGKKEIEQRVNKALETVGLADYGERYIDQLSGGQMQRVAIARAIVNRPRILLLDEPLGALDLKMRKEMQIELKEMQRELGITFVYVTHDQEEALTMSDTIIVMKDGIVQQVDTPLHIYDTPANIFVAGFIGTPPMNFFNGHIEKEDGKLFFKTATISIPLPKEWYAKAEAYINKDIVFGVRPEEIGSERAELDPNSPRIKAKVEVMEPMGAETYLYLDTGDKSSCIARIDAHRHAIIGQEVDLAVSLSTAHLFDKETELLVV